MREFEERMKTYMDATNSTSWMGELFKELSQAADQLENRVAEHEFSDKEINQVGDLFTVDIHAIIVC